VHLDGKETALAHPLAKALVAAGIAVVAPDLRATGAAKPKNDAIAGAPDHNSAEHGLWIGRPLLGQWVVDVRSLLRVMGEHEKFDPKRLSVIGIGQAGVLAIVAAACQHPGSVRSVAAVDSSTSFVADGAYPIGTRMGLLAPGILRAGDVPQLAALLAPTRLIFAGGFSSAGQKLEAKGLTAAFAFTRTIYTLLKRDASFGLSRDGRVAEIIDHL
jgi:pimeloyl-ACP methyl ester carboxylesterase